MKISVTFDVIWLRDSQSFDLDELNINSEQEWLDLTPEEQRERLQTAIDDYVTPPALILDTYKVI